MIVSNYKKNGLIWDFKNKIKNYIRFNKKIFLGDIDKIRRDFLHVTVANDMIINLLENKNYNQVFNLCSSKSVKLSKIFSYLSSKYKINIPYEIDKNINNKFENNIRIATMQKFSVLKDCKKTELDIFRYI